MKVLSKFSDGKIIFGSKWSNNKMIKTSFVFD